MELKEWYFKDEEAVLAEFQVNEKKGLSYIEAKRRLELVGYNELQKRKTVSPIMIFLNQFKDFMIMILLVATLISAMFGEYADAITIIAIVFLNAVLGFFQESKAEKSMDALKKLIAPDAVVIRNGVKVKIPARELVPGDLVALETGDIVPADLRILESNHLEIEESALTGESLPVKKNTVAIKEVANVAIGDRKNMSYSGTTVTRGKGIGIVVHTAMNTEMGQIAGLIQEVKDDTTPLQKRLEQLGKWLVAFCLIIVAVVVVTGILRGENFYDMILIGVSLAVAAIPEGLPAIVTIALAVGVQRMIKKNAIIRKLPAVETLGCATVICSDKTGTLTKNEMTVRKVFVADEEIEVTGEGYEPKGELIGSHGKNKMGLELLTKIAALCNDASLNKDDIAITGLFRNKEKKSSWKITGDPTEGALLVLANKAGIWREKVENREERVFSLPFDSIRKRMSVIYTNHKNLSVYTKGAPDIILGRCSHVLWDDKVVPLTPQVREKIFANNDYMAGQALRILGLAYKELPRGYKYEENEDKIENDLIFVGLAGMIDPPRNEAAEAVKTCKKAGIKTVMITGDHKITAQAVASELDIYNQGDLLLTGNDLDNMHDKELKKIVNDVSVYARVSPKHKLRIVKALKKQGHVVAMTGDGVNDAPAVKEANIGISMGVSGTDVTKESSSMVLGDDNFATIVSAVKEGRSIYNNIRKFIRYLLSCNTGEVLTMFLATLIGLPLPLLPIQILWINLVTDGLPAMALGLDPADPDIMNRKPRDTKESIFAHGLSRRIIIRGTLICISTLAVFIIGFYTNDLNLELARTMAFTALVFSQLFHVFECRSEKYSILEIGIFGNPYLIGAVSFSVIMHLSVIYLPFLQPIFKTQSLGLSDWIVVLGISASTSVLQLLYRSLTRVNLRKLIYSRA